MTKRIIIDTDPGVDDALAFLLALASPEIQLEALTTTQGNVTLEKATANALAVLELAHAGHIPVARGSLLPLVQPLRASAAVHGESGIGNSKLPQPQAKPIAAHAVDYLIERVLDLDPMVRGLSSSSSAISQRSTMRSHAARPPRSPTCPSSMPTTPHGNATQ